ncbi:MAG: ATP synthase F1 subunit delta [Myxococcota bacterium]
MANAVDHQSAVANVYGHAMLALADEQGHGDALLDEVLGLRRCLDADPGFEAFLSSPTVDGDTRGNAVERMFRGRVSDLLVDALQVLNRKERLGALRGVIESYRVAYESRRGRVDVFVATATPLSDAMRRRVTDAAARIAGREPQLVESVDASLIGGLVLRIGDRKMDASVATRLRRLEDALAARASQEIHHGRTYVEQDAH